MKESQIERYLVREVKNHGGLCFKFVSPGNPGVPDRIIVTPDGRSIYVELKTEIGRLAKVQKWQRSELEKRGADVRVLFGMDAVKDFLREVFWGWGE
ncbi:MAG: VRR-NUC domain-containing protein [Oscillospiraceae bacterium]|nr:VRR-NUC domain-containing protein [Oscillospiraceae bacterium]